MPQQCRIQGSCLARTSAYCRVDSSRLALLCLVLTEEHGRSRLRQLEVKSVNQTKCACRTWPSGSPAALHDVGINFIY